jgi:outer membrane immunogenic protein
MKRIIIFAATTAAYTALSAISWNFPAFAADLGRKAPQNSQVLTYGPWNGFYIGPQIGYGWDWSGTDFNAAGTTIVTLGNSPHGLTGGGRIGYDLQNGPFVFGVVTDLNLADFNSNSSMQGLSITNTTNWWGTTNARLGFSQFGDHLLPYVTGGAAYGGKKTEITAIGLSDAASKTSVGWDAGAGIETRISPNVSIYIEGKFVDLGNVQVPIGGILTSDQKFTFGVVQGGVNWRF